MKFLRWLLGFDGSCSNHKGSRKPKGTANMLNWICPKCFCHLEALDESDMAVVIRGHIIEHEVLAAEQARDSERLRSGTMQRRSPEKLFEFGDDTRLHAVGASYDDAQHEGNICRDPEHALSGIERMMLAQNS